MLQSEHCRDQEHEETLEHRDSRGQKPAGVFASLAADAEEHPDPRPLLHQHGPPDPALPRDQEPRESGGQERRRRTGAETGQPVTILLQRECPESQDSKAEDIRRVKVTKLQ